MVTVKQLLLETLKQLGKEELKALQFHLTDLPDGFSRIPKCELEDADRQKTVTLMVQTYNQQVLEVAKKVLKEISRYDLAQNLSERSSEIQDVETQVPKPAEQIDQYQRKLQSNLKTKYESAPEGMAHRRDQQRLDDIFTELFITTGGEVQSINQQHEIRQIEIKGRDPETEIPIEPRNIFQRPTGETRTVLTFGVAGIGKTFLVQKFVLDWAAGKTNQDVHLIFPFTFRQLNLRKGEKFLLADLIHTFIRETIDIPKKELTDIFKMLQASGNHSFKNSKFKLLFVLDGLDESRLQLDFTRSDQLTANFDVTQPTSVDALISALIEDRLLPSARVWITTRPAAVNQIPQKFVHCMTEVRGFTDPQKVDFFTKQFPDERQASKIITHIRASRSLFIMCHIPVFCWITATVLRDVLQTGRLAEMPKTLTEMYTNFLVYQIKLTGNRCGTQKSIHYIQSLAKLAFHQLENGKLIFYEKDLRESGINIRKAAQYAEVGVFTEVFKDEQKYKDDDKGKMFSFVHLSLQEYLAALHVVMSFINDNKNVMAECELKLENLLMLCKRKRMAEVHEIAINKALKSSKGHLDLFLRFLMGLSLQTNQDLLKRLLKRTNQAQSQDIGVTIKSIKDKLRENTSSDRTINLFYCLNELRDDSLVTEIEQYLGSGRLSTERLSPALWSALVFLLLSSEDNLDVFDLKKYSASEEGLLRLLPVIKASKKSLLNGCKLLERSCKALASVLSSQSSKLRELDLSDNDLGDPGVELLCDGLKSPDCNLQTLRLSGCMITKKGCASLASALSSNPSHLRELDLSYNHPGESEAMLLSTVQKNPNFTLNLDHCGEQRLKSGLKKYVCDLTLDGNSAHRNLKLSDGSTKVTTVKEAQPCRHHPDRFDCWLQVLCGAGLMSRCYWEVEWEGRVYIAVTSRDIRRQGKGYDGCLGKNDHSWALLCDDDGGYSVWHEDRETHISRLSSPASSRVAVFLDFPAGKLSFYKLADTLIHLHTFQIATTEPLYPAFGFGFGNEHGSFGSSVSLCEVEDNVLSSRC
ncbi:NACHT, LRR and PYD domains-containing protein 3-like [Centropristis striata]|uniref:NACHT, LRR and PYD domains-containing protein 3-like n=1 Tax=Centropristis striata TaxID=184440 RepID=UPI0027E0D668|nr:NACHT, LRR and PYD domains-containing protein 3-like [Centropristis striata]